VVAAHGVGNLGQIAARAGGTMTFLPLEWRTSVATSLPACARRPVAPAWQQALVQRGHAVVVEARCLRAEDRHLFRTLAPQFAVALVLLGDVAQRILRALAVELVDGDEVGEIEHVDFSSCEAAPNSGVITYIDTSTCGTMAASPWPMPEVSTITRSKPATLQAAMTSGSACEISDPLRAWPASA
jgi:hypothetical protein